MKLQIARSALLDGLQIVQNVVSLRSTLPILSNVLISASKNKLTLTTTDLDLTVRCTIDAEVSKTGETTLPVRRFASIVRELAEGPVEIELNDKNVSAIKSGSSQFQIIGLSNDEFPPIPKADSKICYHLDQGAFKEMLKKTAYAVSTDETRIVLNGILVSFKAGKLSLVTTDGRRLALVENELEFPKENENSMILPAKAVNELMHTLADTGGMNLYFKENIVIFEYGNIMVATKLIEGTYPNYRQVIPARCEERITLERETVLAALRRVALLTTDKSNAVKLTFAKNKLTVLANSPDVGEAKETIPIKYSGKEISVAFNPEYMIDPLKSLSVDEFYFELTDELSPGVIKCDMPFLYVLMPMRIN